MSLWATVLAASALAYALKYLGHLVPGHLLEGARTQRVVWLLPVALLAALVAVQALTGPGGTFVLDARAAALMVAVAALVLRAPFIVVVVLAAVTAGVLRSLGMA